MYIEFLKNSDLQFWHVALYFKLYTLRITYTLHCLNMTMGCLIVGEHHPEYLLGKGTAVAVTYTYTDNTDCSTARMPFAVHTVTEHFNRYHSILFQPH